MPKSSSERSEKTGIAVPAPRQWRGAKRGRSSSMRLSPRGSASRRRFPPSSQRRGSSVRRSATSSLYSIASPPASVRLHSGNAPSERGTMRRQSSSSRPLPAMASTSSGRTVGHATRSVHPSVVCGAEDASREKMPRVKAEA